VSYSQYALAIYPNPSQGMVNLSWASMAKKLTIRNLLGATIFTMGIEPYLDHYLLDVSNYSSGKYTVDVSFLDGHEEKQTIVIQK
jgi:hypothetical protein